MFVSFIHIVTQCCSLLFLIFTQLFPLCKYYYNLFKHSTVDGHLDSSQLGFILNNAL